MTATFEHDSDQVLQLYFNNNEQPLEVTPEHPIWSVDKNDYVPAGNLTVGETVKTRQGVTTLQGRHRLAGTHRVYNIEVYRDHNYMVSLDSILVHNSKIQSDTTTNSNLSIDNELLPSNLSDINIENLRRRLNLSDKDTVAVANTDIDGLSTLDVYGISPSVRKEANLPSLDELYGTERPIKSPRTNALFTRHAEEDILNSLANRIDSLNLPEQDLEGKTINIHISNQTGICTACYQGLTNSNVPAGVIKQFSERYPTLTINISAEGGNARPNRNILSIRNGKILE